MTTYVHYSSALTSRLDAMIECRAVSKQRMSSMLYIRERCCMEPSTGNATMIEDRFCSRSFHDEDRDLVDPSPLLISPRQPICGQCVMDCCVVERRKRVLKDARGCASESPFGAALCMQCGLEGKGAFGYLGDMHVTITETVGALIGASMSGSAILRNLRRCDR